MDYTQKPKYHFRPKKGWINDPNGLIYYKGYYHVFYQHCPNFEIPWKEPVCWGHARTKDFLEWEELPIVLYPDKEYDCGGCWSGTAIVKDDVLYLFYASVRGDYASVNAEDKPQTVSIAYSEDGINFKKYEKNPVIANYPSDGGPDFRDPAVWHADGKYYCTMATGNPETTTARLLLYESDNLFDWKYVSIMSEWKNAKYAECPSVIPLENEILVAASVLSYERGHFFQVMCGSFKNNVFTSERSACFDKGPDQYAGQVFKDHKGRILIVSWVPGWKYAGYAESDIGHMSVPREIKFVNGEIVGCPIEEHKKLFTESDNLVKRTEDGFTVELTGREPFVYKGEITDMKILHDEYIMEIFLNGGKEVYTLLL